MKQAMLFRDPLFFTHVDLNVHNMNMLNASASITANRNTFHAFVFHFFFLNLRSKKRDLKVKTFKTRLNGNANCL